MKETFPILRNSFIDKTKLHHKKISYDSFSKRCNETSSAMDLKKSKADSHKINKSSKAIKIPSSRSIFGRKIDNEHDEIAEEESIQLTHYNFPKNRFSIGKPYISLKFKSRTNATHNHKE